MGIFFRRSRAAYSPVGGPIRQQFDLVRALMHVIIACKYEKDRMKNSQDKVETPFFQTAVDIAHHLLLVCILP